MIDEPTAERLDRIEKRTDELERNLYMELKEINNKLTAMAISQAGRRDCPQPGLCIQLQARLAEFETDKRDLSKDIIAIQKWQAGIIAGLVLLGTIITFFGPAIRHTLGIPQ